VGILTLRDRIGASASCCVAGLASCLSVRCSNALNNQSSQSEAPKAKSGVSHCSSGTAEFF
jgi:hypothetical protein